MKRANGTGTIVKLNGNRRKPYWVRVPARDSRGYVVQKTLGYFAKSPEAQDALDAYNTQKRSGASVAPDKLSMTVQMVYDGWSAREYARLEKKGGTSSVRSHKAAWNKRVSRFAPRKMRDVTLDEWQAILDEDEENCLSQSLINNDAILIRALYAYSMERDIVGKDYSKYLDIPSVDPKKKKGAFTNLQVKKLEQMAASGFPWADTALMLCYTGFRISEFLELTRFAYRPEEGGYLQGGKKTQAGKNRIVPVHPKIAPYLRAHLEAGGDTIITKDGEPVMAAWYRVNAFPAIAAALGEPEATPHWCRHTFATRLHAAGVDELTRKWLMGHSTKADTTDGYTHAAIDLLAEAVRKIA